MSNTTSGLTLREQLKQQRQRGAAKTPPDVQALRRQETQKLIASGIADQSLHKGDTAPDFTLPDVDGRPVQLSALLQKGSVVLSFYRGAWCPYCNLQLRAYQAVLPEIQKLGATLVAISPQVPDASRVMVDKADLNFPVLSDVGNTVAQNYRLVFVLPEILRPHTAKLPEYNGDQSWELPLPGTFVVGTDGVIQLAFVNADYTQRLEPADILLSLWQLRE